jgi:DNA-binding MarR family transcriptional regulator
VKGRVGGARAGAETALDADSDGAGGLGLGMGDTFGDDEELCVLPDLALSEGGPDSIDEFIADWQRERPDLDVDTFGCFARMKMLGKFFANAGDQVLRQHGLNPGEFDVLMALRRSGPGCTLIPSQLSALLMMSRAGMTNRLDRLEASGLVERTVDPADRRSFRVRLTEKGRSIIDAAMTEHAELVNAVGRVLSAEQRHQLDSALRTLLRAFQ